MDNRTVALQKHSEWRGKLDIALRAPIENDEDLAIAYTAGLRSLAWKSGKTKTWPMNTPERVIW